MANEVLLSQLFDQKLLKVISLLLSNKRKEFYLQEIAKDTKVPIASTYRILLKLTKLGIVDLVPISRFKLYRIANNENTRELQDMLIGRQTPLQGFIEQIRDSEGIDEIILHGEETRQGADLVLIGENINTELIKAATAAIKEEYGFSITTLNLTREQFDQMNTMNLFPKRKKTLYKNY